LDKNKLKEMIMEQILDIFSQMKSSEMDQNKKILSSADYATFKCKTNSGLKTARDQNSSNFFSS